MKKIYYLGLAAASMALVLSSCTKDDKGDPIELSVPDTYVSANWEQNIQRIEMYESRFDGLVTYMKTGQDTNVKLDPINLDALFTNGGAASLKSSNADFAAMVESELFPKLYQHSGQSFNPSEAPGATTGGVFINRLLSNKAFEILQAVDKGLYAAGFLKQSIELSKIPLSQANLDEMLKLYGAHPSFPNTSNSANAAHPDKRIANYAARRDQNNGEGIYSQIKRNFLVAQATLTQADPSNQRTSALRAMHLNMEKALAATSINYMYAAIDKLNATNLNDTAKAGALHDLGEAYGFILGLKYINTEDRMISNAQLDEVLKLMGKTANDIEMYQFVNDPAGNLKSLQDAQVKLQAVYAFSTADMTGFKTNWVSAQGR